jgi:hypothetical protein
MTSASNTSGGFVEGVQELLTRVECRPAWSDQEREAIYRLRYSAYHREGALPPEAPKVFRDRFDGEFNTLTFGVYLEGQLASSMRIHVVDHVTPTHPGLSVFGDHLLPPIESGEVLIDPTRFVIDAESSRTFPKLPYVTVRIAWMASQWFGANKLLATVRAEHQAFYRRLFGHKVLCAPRPYPTLTKPLSLMALDFKRERDRVQRRYPFFHSTLAERSRLFGAWQKRTQSMEAGALALVA